MKISTYIIVFFTTLSVSVMGQLKINRIEPPNWWVGMNNENLQLLVQGEGISESDVKIDYPGVELVKVNKADNKSFLFLDLKVTDEAKAGSFDIEFSVKRKEVSKEYQLIERIKRDDPVIDQSDVIYLITPDRFVNGDPSIDEVKGLKDGLDREYEYGRHGGDLAGISSKLDYMEDLGVTALWLNPILENDMPESSYHGYATTDYYKVDPRYGTNESYKKLTEGLHKRGMKMIMDFIPNHCGSEHWWMKDMPFKDWINFHEEYLAGNYVNTTHYKDALSDPHASEIDKKLMESGWFVKAMPDLNQRNPFMANYLTYNTLWWIEYVGLDGIRTDTYPYNNIPFLQSWTGRIYEEYPGFWLVGETWVESESVNAFWAKVDPESDAFNCGVSSTKDFPLCFSMHNAFKEDGELKKVYECLSKDFLYYQPELNMTFLDNHDMDRFYYTIGEDLGRFKMATTLLLTTRGVPQLYYGTEILMKKYGSHGLLREDFPGGWEGDERDAFTSVGRTKEENEAFDHLKKILNWRKTSDAIQNGKLKHFAPYSYELQIKNVYVYARYTDDETVLVILNNNKKPHSLDMTRFTEVTQGFNSAKDIISGKEITDLTQMELKPYDNKILILKP